jgi:hypothetical protein
MPTPNYPAIPAIRHKPLEAIAWRLVQQYLGEANDRADGSAEVLADMGEEGPPQSFLGIGFRCCRHARSRRCWVPAQALLRPSAAVIFSSRRGRSMGLVS